MGDSKKILARFGKKEKGKRKKEKERKGIIMPAKTFAVCFL